MARKRIAVFRSENSVPRDKLPITVGSALSNNAIDPFRRTQVHLNPLSTVVLRCTPSLRRIDGASAVVHALLVVASPNRGVSVHVLSNSGALERKRTLFRDAQCLTVDVTRVRPSVRASPVLQRPATICCAIVKILVVQQWILKIRMMRVVGKEKIVPKVDTIAIRPRTCSSKISPDPL